MRTKIGLEINEIKCWGEILKKIKKKEQLKE